MSESEKRPLVSVVVLGDVGRSPRMRYHAASLAEEGFEVQMIGYAGSSIPEVEESDGKIFITHIREEPPASGTGWKRILSYFWKVMLLSFSLLGALHWLRPPKCVLVQNPPSIPALPVLWFYCLITRARLVVDWHNYGYTILALALKSNHPLVILCRWVEFAFGGRASASFCVTEALGKDLEKNGVKGAVTLYDRPASHFRPLSDEEKARFLDKMGKSYPSAFCQKENPSINKFAELGEDGVFTLRKDRPGVVVSSTSWTEDEDFQMLLTALESYDATAARIDSRPELVVVITGKGPLKEKFVELMDTIHWKKITVITPWLEPGDYPLMLGSADLGVSLHSSSSGLDLPMKVVDMFGAGLPAAALGFDCIEELVQNGCNGVIFGNSTELAASLSDWFKDGTFRDGSLESMHAKFRANTRTFAANGWHSNWRKIALPVIKNL